MVARSPLFSFFVCMGHPKNPIKRFLFKASTSFFSAISAFVLGVYRSTLNFEIVGLENLLKVAAQDKNYILAIWHTFIDAAVFVFHSRQILLYTDHPRVEAYEKSATHYFREIGIKTLESHGFKVLDASHQKQSSGIIQFIKKIEGGAPALISPDGPNGPIYKAKPGAVFIAKKTGGAIIPTGFGFSRKIVGVNWDDFALPLPFSRVCLVIGEPLFVPEDVSAEEQEEMTSLLEEQMDALCFQANRIIRHTVS